MKRYTWLQSIIVIISLIALVLVFCMATLSCASSFLVCDPSPTSISQVEVEIVFASVTTIYSGTYTISGSDIRLYDLLGLANGSYTFRARWADSTGWWSDWSDPLNAVKSGKPGNFRIK